MPNFSSLARLEVPEKFLWVGGVGGWGGVVQGHFIVKPNHVLRLGWGFDNSPNTSHLRKILFQINYQQNLLDNSNVDY